MSAFSERIREAALGPAPNTTPLQSLNAWLPGYMDDPRLFVRANGWRYPRNKGWFFNESSFVLSDADTQRTFLLLVAEALE